MSRTHTADQDTILRMALASMAADKSSTLTLEQRQWVIALAQRTTPLTPAERGKLRSPLLAWVETRQPRILDIVMAQFHEED
jgi:hypothetical protein